VVAAEAQPADLLRELARPADMPGPPRSQLPGPPAKFRPGRARASAGHIRE